MPTQTQVESKKVEMTVSGTVGTAATLTVPQADWSKYLRLKAEAAALEKQVKQLEQSFAFPAPEDIAKLYGAVPGETLALQIVNGNGDTVDKMSVFYYPGAEIGPGWRKRIS